MVEVKQAEGIWLDIIVPHLICDKLEQCLRSLRKNTPPCFRVILIDQSKNDNSRLQAEGLVDVIVKLKRNIGFSAAVNMGLRMTNAPYVMALNDDTVFLQKTWLQDGMTVFAERPDAAAWNASSPRNPNGVGDTVDQHPSEFAIQEGQWTDEDILAMKKLFDPNSNPNGNQIYMAGCTWATVIKRSALEALGKHEGSPVGLGLFDENIPDAGSDYDWVRRLGLIGLRFYGTYRSWIYHYWLSTRKMMKEAGYGEDAYTTTKNAYSSWRLKWGPTWGIGPNDSTGPEAADVYGRNGPKEPLNGQPFFTILPL